MRDRQNLLPVSLLGHAEYAALSELSAEQRVQPVPQNLSAELVDPLRGESGAQLGVAASGERTTLGDPGLSALVGCEVRHGLVSHNSGVSTKISTAQQGISQQVTAQCGT